VAVQSPPPGMLLDLQSRERSCHATWLPLWPYQLRETWFQSKYLALVAEVDIIRVPPFVRRTAQRKEHHALNIRVPHPWHPDTGHILVPACTPVEGGDKVLSRVSRRDGRPGVVTTWQLHVAMPPARFGDQNFFEVIHAECSESEQAVELRARSDAMIAAGKWIRERLSATRSA
jgi:hypothetical protein